MSQLRPFFQCRCSILLVLSLVACVCLALPFPDSAGIVPRVNGLAYGGIPYGSVSGALANYRPIARRGPNAGPSGVRVSRPRFGGLSPHLLNSVYI